MNFDKCQLVLSSNDENKKMELNGEVINSMQMQNLLGVYINHKLKSNTHIETLRKKAGKKLHALARVINIYKLSTVLMRSFIMSQFGYSFGCFIVERLITK